MSVLTDPVFLKKVAGWGRGVCRSCGRGPSHSTMWCPQSVFSILVEENHISQEVSPRGRGASMPALSFESRRPPIGLEVLGLRRWGRTRSVILPCSVLHDARKKNLTAYCMQSNLFIRLRMPRRKPSRRLVLLRWRCPA